MSMSTSQVETGAAQSSSRKSALAAGALYSILVFAVGALLGTVRTFALAPLLGDTPAVLLELPVMLAVSWLACSWLCRLLAVPASWRARLLMGGTAFLLLLAAELALSVLVLGRSVGAHLGLYAHLSSLLGLAAQVAFAAFPWLQALPRQR